MGKLILIGLPIGNPSDITERAKNGLIHAKTILCEDTRVTLDLMRILGIEFNQKKLISYHDHTTENKTNELIELLNHQDVYLCSDAGSPCISDPAFPFIRKALSLGHDLESLTGVSSVICALELSGLPSIPFHFHGFIARDNSGREKLFDSILANYGTHVFFEAPTRVKDTLNTIHEFFSEEEIVVARELTKIYQSVYRFKAKEIPENLKQIVEKGEFVILIHQQNSSHTNKQLTALAQDVLEQKGKSKILAKLLAEILNKPVKEIYQELSTKD